MEATKRQCAERVYASPTFNGYLCSKPAKYNEAGRWWCSIHAPSKVAEKRQKQAEKAKAEHEIWKAKHEERVAAHERARVCAEALAGVPHPEHLPKFLSAVRSQILAWKNYQDTDSATISFELFTEHLVRIASATAEVDIAYAALMGEAT